MNKHVNISLLSTSGSGEKWDTRAQALESNGSEFQFHLDHLLTGVWHWAHY